MGFQYSTKKVGVFDSSLGVGSQLGLLTWFTTEMRLAAPRGRPYLQQLQNF